MRADRLQIPRLVKHPLGFFRATCPLFFAGDVFTQPSRTKSICRAQRLKFFSPVEYLLPPRSRCHFKLKLEPLLQATTRLAKRITSPAGQVRLNVMAATPP